MSRIAKILIGILIFLVVLAILGAILAKPAQSHLFYEQTEGRPLVIAHQGGDGQWPSNTMFAFEKAASLGVDMLEMDLHITADDVLVLMHDETVDRTTNGVGSIEKMSLAKLKQLDAGYRWSKDNGVTFPFRNRGITIPSLEELFQAFPDVPMNIELKYTEKDMAPLFCDLIRQYEMEDKVLVASFHDDAMQSFRETCPEVATSAPQNEIVPLVLLSKVGFGFLYSPKAVSVQVPESRSGIHILTPTFIKAVQGRNMKVDAWTINNQTDMKRMIDLGVDGIITDYPELLMETLDRDTE